MQDKRNILLGILYVDNFSQTKGCLINKYLNLKLNMYKANMKVEQPL
jgi:hypothetical protein